MAGLDLELVPRVSPRMAFEYILKLFEELIARYSPQRVAAKFVVLQNLSGHL